MTPIILDAEAAVIEIRDERDVTSAEPVVRKCVAWAVRRPWRSITVAAGTMPESLTTLPTLRATAVRWEVIDINWRLEIQGPGDLAVESHRGPPFGRAGAALGQRSRCVTRSPGARQART